MDGEDWVLKILASDKKYKFYIPCQSLCIYGRPSRLCHRPVVHSPQ